MWCKNTCTNWSKIFLTKGRTPTGKRIYLCDTDQALQQFHCRAVIGEWMIPFAASQQPKLPMLFNGSDNLQKLPLPVEASWPPSNTWFLVPTRVSPPNGISIVGWTVIAQRAQQTDRLTHRPTDHVRYSLCSNRPLSLANRKAGLRWRMLGY